MKILSKALSLHPLLLAKKIYIYIYKCDFKEMSQKMYMLYDPQSAYFDKRIKQIESLLLWLLGVIGQS